MAPQKQPAGVAAYAKMAVPGPGEPKAHDPAAAVGVPLPPKGLAVP